ncbi:hypothetical protein BD408DRAFT_417380 [Parasitella parasitica]|nr:hypothetical protein BD408DRAFT_417380 [Parasitella parasitica]
MASNAFSEGAIKEAIRQKACNPCNQVIHAVAKKGMPNIDILNESSKPKVLTFLSAYLENYKFKIVSIFYDVNANPENHFKAFVKLAELFESVQLKQFFCFPLRTTFIPCYMTLDNKIIHYHIIQSKKPLMPRSQLENWGSIVKGP